MLHETETSQRQNCKTPTQLVTSPKVSRAIQYYANYIAKLFKLRKDEKEDIVQTLVLAALVAQDAHRDSMKAGLLTYIKTAVRYEAIDIMRCLDNAPKIVSYEEECTVGALERYHRRVELDFHAELSGEPKQKEKRLQVNCGDYIEQVAIAPEQSNPDLKLDMRAIMQNLTIRQRTICRMLMAGKSLQHISDHLKMDKSNVSRAIKSMRPMFRQVGYAQ